MTEAIGNVGDTQNSQSARVAASPVPTDASTGQLGQMLLKLANDIGDYSSPEQIGSMLSSARLVVGTGLPALDVADAIYSSELVLDAMKSGNPTLAKQAAIEQLTGSLAELRASGLPDASLRTLSSAGFAAGEIAFALRTVPNFREAMMQSDSAQWRQMAATLHQLFRENGRSTHSDPSMLAALGTRVTSGLDGVQGSWFVQYENRIRAAQKRSIGDLRPEDHPELMLFYAPQPDNADENSSAGIGPWLMAVIVAVAVLLIFLSRC